MFNYLEKVLLLYALLSVGLVLIIVSLTVICCPYRSRLSKIEKSQTSDDPPNYEDATLKPPDYFMSNE